MKVKVSEATPLQLNWMVSAAESVAVVIRRWTFDGEKFLVHAPGQFSEEAVWCPSEDWAQGGPIIERERIMLIPEPNGRLWTGCIGDTDAGGKAAYAHAPLIAAMRCYVVSKLGDTVDVPKELLK